VGLRSGLDAKRRDDIPCLRRETNPLPYSPRLSRYAAHLHLSILSLSMPIIAQRLAEVRFPALPDFLTSSGFATGFTQPREYKCGAAWKIK
jgi:hypothetical protein